MTVHLMCDLETLGTRPGAIILAAAFVRFQDEAHCTLNLSMTEQQALGMEIDDSTMAWWRTQTPEAWLRATENPQSIVPSLQYFSQWLQWAGGDDYLLWCHGATFDAPLLEELFRRAGVPCPWKFWQVRDTRTLYDLAGVNVKDYAVSPPHIALNDAIGQTRAANVALSILSRAHAVPRRYFYHPESDCLFFTDDGSHPNDGLVEEIGAGEYVRRTGTESATRAA